jgi:acyl-CoA thioesterase
VGGEGLEPPAARRGAGAAMAQVAFRAVGARPPSVTDHVRTDRRTLPREVQSALSELDPLITGSPLLGTFGGAVVDWGPGWAEVEMPTSDATANIAGTVHGAVISAAADCAFETACNSYGRISVAVSLNGQFTAAAPSGTTLRAVAYEISRSRALASYRVDVTQRPEPGAGLLVACFQAMAHRSREWHLGAARWPDAWIESH